MLNYRFSSMYETLIKHYDFTEHLPNLVDQNKVNYKVLLIFHDNFHSYFNSFLASK